MIVIPSFSLGNEKVKNTFIWSIMPVETCIGSTPECRKACYDLRACKRWENVRDARARNTILARSGDFEPLVCNWLICMLHTKKCETYRHFRIHEGGDFFSQAYLDAWIRICNRFPRIKFTAYTQSIELDFSNRPKNMSVYFSVWPDTKASHVKMAKRKGLRLSTVKKTVPKRTKAFVCGSKGKTCDKCRVCWANKFDVIFKEH